MAFTALTTAETDAKSPIDDRLFQKIKDDLDDLNSRVITAGAWPFVLEVHGKLANVLRKRSIAAGLVNADFAPSSCRFMLKLSGTSGSLAFDIRKHTSPLTPITAISHQYTGNTTGIARQGSSKATQSIARAATQISTQSITHAKAANNVQSIIGLGTVSGLGSNLWQYNLASTIDSDTIIGDSIVFASCTTGANNGTFTIVDKNRGGGNNVVITNASGVAQTGVAGTAQVKIMSYNFTNPVDSLFGAGYSHTFASHTNAANNGALLVYAINNGGNNIWVKNSTGAVQASTPGTVDTLFWKFAFTVAASVTDYIVGEAAVTAAHTSGGNNAAALTIVAVNSGGNNVVLYNTAGVAQAGILGNVNTNRWAYTMPSDPTAQVSAGYTVYCSSHSSALNDGLFTVKEVTASVIIVYNTSGLVQGGTAGSVSTTRKLIQFASDQSAVYTTASFIEMQGCVDTKYNYDWSYSPLPVVQVNRGGGANYNVVVDMATDYLTVTRYSAAAQTSPAGYVQVEMKSIFSSAPTLANSVTSLEANHNIAGSSTSFPGTTVTAQTPLNLYLTTIPSGDPRDLTVILR